MSYRIQKYIARVKPYVPGKPIEEVKRELGLTHVIKLASNENPYGPSPKVLKAIVESAKTINRYPDGDCFYLRQRLAKHLKVETNQLIFGNGSDEIIVFATKALVCEGDEVVIAKPSFLIYDIASQLAGARVKAIPLVNFRYDLKAMKVAVSHRTKMVFLGNPDNPAGSYFTEKEVHDFMRGLPEQILVFIDEAYYEYVQAKDYVQSIGLLRKYKNILVARTFSKMYGLAGLRIGYGIGYPKLIDILNRVREPFNVNSLAQAAALSCLNDQSYYKEIARKIEGQRSYFYVNLTKLKLDFVKTCTNFILIDMKQKASQLVQKLLARGVIVRDMEFWGMANYIRVTIGTEVENKKFIKELSALI